MVSKNNIQEKIRKIESQKEHYAVRKLATGTASVLIGLTFMGTTGRTVKASTETATGESRIELEEKVDNTNTSQSATTLQENIQTSEVVETPAENTETVQTERASNVTESVQESATTNENTQSTLVASENAQTETVTPQSEASKEVATNQVETPAVNEISTQNNGTEQKIVESENITAETPTDIKVETEVAEKAETSTEVKEPTISKVETENVKEDPASKVEINLNKEQNKVETTDKIKNPNKTTDKTVDANKDIIDLNAEITDGKVTITATDPNNYPTDAGNLVGKDKYIYQTVNLNGTWNKDSVLILAIDRNNPNNGNIYAYVTDKNYGSISQNYEIATGKYQIITVNGNRYQISNTGISDIIINDQEIPTQNSSTITGGTAVRKFPQYMV